MAHIAAAAPIKVSTGIIDRLTLRARTLHGSNFRPLCQRQVSGENLTELASGSALQRRPRKPWRYKNDPERASGLFTGQCIAWDSNAR